MYKDISLEAKEALKSDDIIASAKLIFPNIKDEDGNELVVDDELLLDSCTITDFCSNEGQLIGTAMTKEAELYIDTTEFKTDLKDQEFELYGGVQVPFGQEEKNIQGTNIVINKAMPNSQRNIQINGKSTQETRSGKNLANVNNIANSAIQVENNGQTILMPVATSGNGYTTTRITLQQLCPDLKVGDVAILSFKTSYNTINKWIHIAGPAITWVLNKELTITQELLGGTVLLYSNSATDNETEQLIITDFEIILKGQEIEPWEAYGISPSPEFPCEIKNVGDNGKIVINNHGKNLLPDNAKKDTESHGVTFEYNKDGSYTVNGTATRGNGVIYVVNSPSNPLVLKAGTYYTINEDITSGINIVGYTGRKYITFMGRLQNSFILEENTSFKHIYLQLYNGYTANNIKIYPMISTTPIIKTSFEPYYSKDYVLQLDEPLRGLPNGVKDTLAEDGIHRKNGFKVLDGTENFVFNELGETYARYALNVSDVVSVETQNKNIYAISNVFKGVTGYDMLNSSSIGDSICVVSNQRLLIKTIDSELFTLTNFKNWLSEQYNAGTPVTVQYELAEEVIEPLSDENKEILNSFKLIENYNNLSSDAEMSLDYIEKVEGESSEYIPLGKYIITDYEDTKSNNKFKIIAYDFMTKLNEKFVDNTRFNPTFPISLKEFYKQLVSSYGIELVEQTLPNENFQIEEMPNFDGYTSRNVLGKIAELCGKFVKINRDNKCEMYLQNETSEIIDDNIMNTSLVINDKYGPINVVSVGMSNVEGENVTLKDDESINENGENELDILDNPFVYTEELREQVIQELYNALNGFEYYATEFKGKALFYLDNGDEVEVLDVKSNQYVKTLILNQTIDIPKTRNSKYESKALTKTAVKNKYISQTKQAQTRTEIIVDKQSKQIESIVEKIGDRTEKSTTVTQDIEGISIIASNTETNLNNNYLTKEQVEAENDTLKKDLDIVKKQQTEVKVNAKGLQVQIDSINNEGVKTVKNTTVDINENGVSVGKSDSEFSTTMNNTGTYMYAYGNQIAKYDKDGMETRNLTATGAVEISYLKIVKADVDGEKRTHIHWIGGE